MSRVFVRGMEGLMSGYGIDGVCVAFVYMIAGEEVCVFFLFFCFVLFFLH